VTCKQDWETTLSPKYLRIRHLLFRYRWVLYKVQKTILYHFCKSSLGPTAVLSRLTQEYLQFHNLFLPRAQWHNRGMVVGLYSGSYNHSCSMLSPQGRPLETLVSRNGASPVLRAKEQPGVQSLLREAFVNDYVSRCVKSQFCVSGWNSWVLLFPCFSVGQDRAALCVIFTGNTQVCHLCFCLAAALISFTFSPEDKN
jgi:hypothetical protein